MFLLIIIQIKSKGYLKEVCHINHRDIKPGNILKFVDPKTGKISWKLTDLGTVKMLDASKIAE